MRVLVTGGSGFIGTPLVGELVRRGCRVRVVDLRPPRGREPGVELVRADLARDPLPPVYCATSAQSFIWRAPVFSPAGISR